MGGSGYTPQDKKDNRTKPNPYRGQKLIFTTGTGTPRKIDIVSRKIRNRSVRIVKGRKVGNKSEIWNFR